LHGWRAHVPSCADLDWWCPVPARRPGRAVKS